MNDMNGGDTYKQELEKENQKLVYKVLALQEELRGKEWQDIPEDLAEAVEYWVTDGKEVACAYYIGSLYHNNWLYTEVSSWGEDMEIDFIPTQYKDITLPQPPKEQA